MENYNYNEPTEESVDFKAPVTEEAPAVEEVVESPGVEEALLAHEAPVEEEPAEPLVEVIIEDPKPEIQGLGNVNGAIGVAMTPVGKKKPAKKTSEKKETVALHSTKNVTWSGVGKVYRGYNIVEKNASEKWLTRSHIRVATPEEVAKEFGK
jgi:hypothetical protein